jgi:hypothetical protein
LALSSSVRIAQNNIKVSSVDATAWSNTTSFYKPFRVDAIDTEACTVAAFVLVNQKGKDGVVPGLMSVRIKTQDDSTTVTELEVLNVLKGSHAFFQPQTFPNTAPAMWSTPQAGNVARAELIKIANTYPSGIQAGDGSKIPGGATCPRIENGVQTSAKCYQNLAVFKQIVRDRRWVADTVTGVVLGGFYFDKVASKGANYGLYLNEYFKIDNGKLMGIQACMKELPGKFVDFWGA